MKKIDVVHLVYLSIIWLLITAFIAGVSFLEDTNVVNAFSIASACISIIIGVIAIFITIYQGLSQGLSVQKINESAERVEIATKRLESFEFEKIDQKMDKILDSMSNDFKPSSEPPIDNDIEISVDAVKKIFIKAKVDITFAYYIINSYRKDIDLDMVGFSKIFVNNINLYRGSCIEYLSLLKRAGLLLFEGSPTENYIKIIKVDEKYIQAFETGRSNERPVRHQEKIDDLLRAD
ncbi:hypothetical protein [Bacillus sp. AG4(2022)]|uniref:hypothetical protein n=1 Tax=Bacillus sp. AG4(2022) TaxID=2962594 RepID=UPI0028824352|nr:hypothetical protein [Bacillus sp. AG4(2022)]MDT0161623.1 hypothetical protein [Bacillus sp. AG4(2022)]